MLNIQGCCKTALMYTFMLFLQPFLQVITPFNIYFNARLIFQKGEVWRLLTTFMFFGSLGQYGPQIRFGDKGTKPFSNRDANQYVFAAGLDFVFHMFFLIKYSKSLEEGSFRGRSADFLWMLLIGEALLTCHVPRFSLYITSIASCSHKCLICMALCCRWSSAHMLCPFCKHSVLGFFFDLHDGELSGVGGVLQLPSHGSFCCITDAIAHICANDEQCL